MHSLLGMLQIALQYFESEKAKAVQVLTLIQQADMEIDALVYQLYELSEEEIAIIEKYLPQQMTEEEVKAELAIIIKETGASTPSDLGKVMGAATKKFGGKTDGKTISTLAKQMLTN